MKFRLPYAVAVFFTTFTAIAFQNPAPQTTVTSPVVRVTVAQPPIVAGSELRLVDAAGRIRGRMYIDAGDVARFELMDATGNVTWKGPE